MIQKCLILFTILTIFQEYKGAQCANAISEYTHVFDINAFDEFNLICYISTYVKLLMLMKNIQEDPRKKYLNQPDTIWDDFDNITKWFINTHSTELTNVVLHNVMSTTNFSKFNGFNWTTPKGKKLYEILMTNSNEEIEKMLPTTLEFCKVTLNTLTTPTLYLEAFLQIQFNNIMKSGPPVSVIHGYVILLFKDEYFEEFMNKKNTYTQSMVLVYIINQALQDIYLGIEHILGIINAPRLWVNPENYYTNIQFVKMIITVYYNAVKLTEELFLTKDIKGVKDKLYKLNKAKSNSIKVYYDYNNFKDKFQSMLSNLLSLETGSQADESGPSALSDGRLIKNGKVDPSIIGYYAVYEESWENMEAIDYANNTDDKTVFLMELNAWATVLYQALQELRRFLLPKGLCDVFAKKPNFTDDKNSIKQFELLFQYMLSR